MNDDTAITIGLNCAHDNAACLVSSKGIEIAIREERLSRQKYQHGFPRLALDHCLAAAGCRDINEIDCFVINQYPMLDCHNELRSLGYEGKVYTHLSHHLLHAYYCMYMLEGDEAIILILDGSGYAYGTYARNNLDGIKLAPESADMEEAESIYHYRNGQLKVYRKRWGVWDACEPYFRFPSLGHMYSMASQYIFGNQKAWVHAGKVMGLASYGDAKALNLEILKTNNDQQRIDTEWVYQLPQEEPQEKFNGKLEFNKLKRDIAATVQQELEKGVSNLVEELKSATNATTLCYSGGVALNSVANGKIANIFDHFLITPAADDAGVAIGGALYGFKQVTGKLPEQPYRNDFHGMVYCRDEISTAVEVNQCVTATEFIEKNEFAKLVAEDIAAGKIVGFYEGASEFGPRSLGHRSILANPKLKNIKEILNSRVKYRESFRPYAACVLSEHVGDYFEYKDENPYMLIVARILEFRKEEISGVCHIDGTCRIQTISQNYPGMLRSVVEEFAAITGTPIILNTSFNIKNEPIVETPQDAIDCFLATGIDLLYIYPYRLSKIQLSKDAEHLPLKNLIPILNAGISLVTRKEPVAEGPSITRHSVKLRTDRILEISAQEFDLLNHVDNNASLGNLAIAFQLSEKEVLRNFTKLQQKGLISFLNMGSDYTY